MTPEASFIADILAGDRQTALIYADWLDDAGRPEEALHVRFCAQSHMQPLLSRTGKLCWWDPIFERFHSRHAVGKVWEVRVWTWTPRLEEGFPTSEEGALW